MNEGLSLPARDSQEFAAQIYGVKQATNAHKQQRGNDRWWESLDGAPL